MRQIQIPFPEIVLIAGTRGMLGAGIGMLIADHIAPKQRQTIGWSLVAIGVLSTFPLAADLLRRSALKPTEEPRVRENVAIKQPIFAG